MAETLCNLEGGGNLVDIIYPVGSIYMSVNDTDPSLLFHGTWERIKDRFLLASGDTYSAGSTGGEAQHTLTVDEMPKHNHNYQSKSFLLDAAKRGGFGSEIKDVTGSYIAEAVTPNVMFTGGSQPHNNMPPYLTVYIWKRIA